MGTSVSPCQAVQVLGRGAALAGDAVHRLAAGKQPAATAALAPPPARRHRRTITILIPPREPPGRDRRRAPLPRRETQSVEATPGRHTIGPRVRAWQIMLATSWDAVRLKKRGFSESEEKEEEEEEEEEDEREEEKEEEEWGEEEDDEEDECVG